MTTFANLQTRVSDALRDTANKTFNAQTVADLINDGFAEISRIAPKRFVEDVSVVADALTYALTAGTSPEVEIKRVEVWDVSVTPNKQIARLDPASASPESNSQAGWEYWAGVLRITNATENGLIVGTHKLKVWGYVPYTTVDIASAATTDQGLSNELEKAVIYYAQMEGFSRLIHDRSLFAQWQGQSNNTDTSMAAIMGAWRDAQSEWRMRSRALAVLREPV